MKRGIHRLCWPLLAALLICLIGAALGEAATVRFVGPAAGVNSGLLTQGQGTSNARINAYFASGMTDFSSLRVRFVLDGSGFSNYPNVFVTRDNSSFASQRWEEDGVMVGLLDGKGAFPPQTMTLKRKPTAGLFTAPETVTFTLMEGVFPGPRTGTASLTIVPVPIALPLAVVPPVSLLLGTDYSASNRVSVNFMGQDGKKVSLGGMTLSQGGTPVAVSSAGSYVWDSAAAVTVAPNLDSTALFFATPQAGAPSPKVSSVFQVGASTVNLPWDNNAAVAGIAAGTPLFSFNVDVHLGGTIALSAPGVNQFKELRDANNLTVYVAPTPSTVNLVDLKIADADGSNPEASKSLNNLLITADPATRSIKFSGIPSSSDAGILYKVLWYVNATDALSADLTVKIDTADVYTLRLSTTLIDGLAKGVALTPGANDIAVSFLDGGTASPDIAASGLVVEPSTWNGLTFTPDAGAQKITVGGTPLQNGRQTFSVSADVTGAVVSPSYMTFDVVVHDSLASISLDVVPKVLVLPVLVSTDTKMDILPAPASVDAYATGAVISYGSTVAYSWNGLDIVPWANVAHSTFWLRVTGMMAQPLSQDFSVTFLNTTDAVSADFVISGDVPTAGGSKVFADPNAPALFDLAGNPLTQADPGNFVEADYALKPGSGANVIGLSIRGPDGAVTVLEPILDGTSQGDPGFLFDPLHNRLAVRSVPLAAGIYTLTVYYELGGRLYTETATLRVGGDGGGEVPSSEARILRMRLTVAGREYRGIFQADGKTIVMELPAGTDVTALSPSITLSVGASLSPTGPYDFSRGPVTVKVTAADGATANTYLLVVNLERDSVVESAIVDPLPADARAVLTSSDRGIWHVDWRIRFNASFDAPQLEHLTVFVQDLSGVQVSYLDASGAEAGFAQSGAAEYWLKIAGTAASREALANVVLKRVCVRKVNDDTLYVQDLVMPLRDVPGGVPSEPPVEPPEEPGRRGGGGGGCNAGFAAAGLLLAAGASATARRKTR